MSEFTPIYSEEAERATLGCFMLEANSLDEAASKRVTADWFHDIRHRDLYVQLVTMRDARSPIDLMTVHAWLKDRGLVENIGGLAYLSGHMDLAPSASNIDYYLDLLLKKRRHRMALEMASTVETKLRGGDDPDAVIEKAEAAIMGIRAEDTSDGEADGKDVARAAIDLLEERCRGKSGAIKTNWPAFDRFTRGGLLPKKLYVIAGRPGDGKTAMAISMALNIADETPTAFFSLEMGNEEIGDRMLAARSRIEVGQFDERCHPSEGQQKSLVVASVANSRMKLKVIDTPAMTINSIIARTRRLVRSMGVKVVFVDYLQLITSPDRRKERREVVDEVSRGLKLMAKELSISVVALAQLNREIEKDKGRKPQMSDLRESGSIEQDADFIGILWRPEIKKGEAEVQEGPRDVSLRVAKQRAGKAGFDIRFTFNPAITRFDPWSPITSEDIKP